MTQPPLVIPSDVEVAQAGKSLLANGSALYTLASDDFEVLRVTFVFRAGSAMQRVPFSASAAANMLAEGTRDMTAHQIAERLDYYGSYYDVNIDQILRRNARRSRTDTPAPRFPRGGTAHLLRQAQAAAGRRTHEGRHPGPRGFRPRPFRALAPLRHLGRRSPIR